MSAWDSSRQRICSALDAVAGSKVSLEPIGGGNEWTPDREFGTKVLVSGAKDNGFRGDGFAVDPAAGATVSFWMRRDDAAGNKWAGDVFRCGADGTRGSTWFGPNWGFLQLDGNAFSRVGDNAWRHYVLRMSPAAGDGGEASIGVFASQPTAWTVGGSGNPAKAADIGGDTTYTPTDPIPAGGTQTLYLLFTTADNVAGLRESYSDVGTLSVNLESAFSRRAFRNDHHSPATGTSRAKIRKTGFANLMTLNSQHPTFNFKLQTLNSNDPSSPPHARG